MTDKLFTSDWHIGDPSSIRRRGFSSAEEHDSTIVNNALSMCNNQTQLYILGDLVGRAEHWGSAIDYIASMKEEFPGMRVYLISGNHCPTHPKSTKSGKYLKSGLEVFESISSIGEFKANKVLDPSGKVMMSHFPYTADREEERYGDWRVRDNGRMLFCGHLHLPIKFVSWKEVHVGLDAWNMFPVSLETITTEYKEYFGIN